MSCCAEKDICFYNFNQNDTEEFINIFMNLLHESIKLRAETSVDGTPTNQIERLQVKSVKSWSDFFKNDYSYIIQKFYSQQLTIMLALNVITIQSTLNHLWYYH